MVIVDFFKGLIAKVVGVTALQCLWMLVIATGIVFLYCFITVLIKIYASKGIAWLLLGIFIPFFAFIWWWIKNEELEDKNTMITWTITIVVALALYGLMLMTV
jgi:hypothetical protein